MLPLQSNKYLIKLNRFFGSCNIKMTRWPAFYFFQSLKNSTRQIFITNKHIKFFFEILQKLTRRVTWTKKSSLFGHSYNLFDIYIYIYLFIYLIIIKKLWFLHKQKFMSYFITIYFCIQIDIQIKYLITLQITVIIYTML